jgi:hypothetical protein
MSGTRLPSYRPCPHTGQECPFGTAAEPCWGPVTMWSDFFDEERHIKALKIIVRAR